jgi:glycolate oxidase
MALKTKTLSREVYAALEDVVGPDYISQEPAILDGYAYHFSNDLLLGGDRFGPRPLAVVMPASTEEIQSIVKVCNRYRVQFKAFSTGFGSWASTGAEPALSVDLRRMDRILEIDGKNAFAVVEPYVSFAELSYETIKKGLRPYSIGAGPSCSILANATSGWGMGVTNVSAGYGARNLLGVEWVLPDGEILRLGTVGTGSGWFNGDGPGPSLLGVARGYVGAMGSLGVFTKAAIKLVPWYGPPTMDTPGEPPAYIPKLPDCFRVYTIAFPSRESLYEAMRLTAEEDLQYSGSRRGPYTMARGMAKSNKEMEEIWATGYYQDKFANCLAFIMDASSPREMEYKEKCLRKIVAEYRGEIITEEERAQSTRFVHAFIGANSVKSTFSTGSFMSAPNAEESLDCLLKAHKLGLELKEEYARKGAVLDDGDPSWVSVCEPCSHVEIVWRYDPADPNSVKGAIELASRAGDLFLGHNLDDSSYLYFRGRGKPKHHDIAGPKCLNYHEWIGRIKKAFDPNGVGEPSWYPTAKE